MTLYANAILGLFTQTSLHAGSGESDNIIDLPIQREAHSAWPVVYGSGVKGALRAKAELKFGTEGKDSVDRIFGPDTENASDHAGSLLVGDARLVLFPVRSLTTHYRLVTCPSALKRLARDALRCGLLTTEPNMPTVADDQAVISSQTTDLFLEEYRFKTTTEDLADWVNLLTNISGDGRKSELETLLTVVSDNSFRHLVSAATPLRTRIRINQEKGTVADGALWNEESLSPETLLYTTLSAAPARDGSGWEPQQILSSVVDELFKPDNYLQLGGNQTTGMGWCEVSVWEVAQ